MAFDNIHLEKGMYRQAGKSFTQVLESMDPSENYKGTAMEGTDAFQRQLKRFSIRCKGSGSDPVEKFFHTSDSAVLFPEYVSRTVRQGMEEENILSSLVATTTVIDAMDYRTLYTENSEDDLSLARVAEGAEIPATKITTSEHLIPLYKRGRMLEASYEALRFQKLDLFSLVLRQIGNHIARMHTADAIQVLLAGDGNDNAAPVYTIGTDPMGGTAGKLSYDQLVEFWAEFSPYTLGTLVAAPTEMPAILSLPQMQDATAGLNFHGTGKLVTPMGAQLVQSSAVDKGVLIGLDNRYALEMVQAGEVSVEFDKLIDRQLERAAITSISGFAKLCTDACKVLYI